ncbi:MAG: tetratricopeptide repeat protein [Candidatus Pacebacteria bacterium]|nr:tetratricopeptide repeat protein [Candidatus Paceibacterota bacterium]
MKVSCAIIGFFSVFCILGATFAQGEGDVEDLMRRARNDMRARQFENAVRILEDVLSKQPTNADEVLFLKARGHYHLQHYEEAEQTAARLTEAYADSPWFHKARFLRARALVEQKKFKQAEEIYEAEANRLLSQARKHEVAGVIVAFADKLAHKPSPDDLDATPPNYQKAYTLYGKALEMEIGRPLRDDLMFKRARAIQQANNHHQAINDYQAYLREFDPQWRGAAGVPGGQHARFMENPPSAGSHVYEARFYLAAAFKDTGQWAHARWEAEDLLRRLETENHDKNRLAVDTRWLVVQTHQMPAPAADEIHAAVKAARLFLAHAPRDPRAVRAAYYIPEASRHVGRSELAIEAFEEFIEGKGYALPEGEAATQVMADVNKSPAELQSEWRQQSLFNIGTIQFAQKNYDAAITTWQEYVKRFPNGPHWAESQNGIVNAEFQQGVQALASKEHDKARTLFEAFLRDYPLDNRARQILFTFGQVYYAEAEELEGKDADAEKIAEAYRRAVGEWAKLVNKYPNTEESSLALYRTGVIYEEKLGELETALDTYRRLTWGSYAARARQRIAVMTNKELEIRTERTFRTDETPCINVRTRNIEKVSVKMYRLDLEAYFRKMHMIGAVESLDVGLIEPDKVWEVTIADYAKFKPLEQSIEIPFDGNAPGAYVVNVSEEDWQATTLVVRSNIDIIFKSSRRETLVFAQNMRTDEPEAGVRVLLSDGQSIIAEGETGGDGVFHTQVQELRGLGGVGVFAVSDGHTASYNLDLAGLQLGSGLTPKGYMYTDRPAYRPGEHVGLRAIIRTVNDGLYKAPGELPFEVEVTDANGRLLRAETLKLSAFGTLHTAFDLPEAAPLGQYTITARHKPEDGTPLVFNTHFLVQEFKLEKIRLTIDFPRRVYFRGETIEGEVTASYYWGEPVANAPVRYSLPDGRTYESATDEQGKLAVRFDTSPMHPGRPLPFAATLTAENVSTQHTVFLARLGFSAAVQSSQDVVLAGEPVDMEVTTTGADGEPVGKDVILYVLQRRAAEPEHVLGMIPWIGSPSHATAEVTVQEHQLSTDPANGKARRTITLEEGGEYILRVAGQDRFDQTVTAQSGLQVSDEEDAVKLRLFADSATLRVGSEASVRLHSRIDSTLALVTYEGETILRYKVVKAKPGYNVLDFAVGHDLFPNFRIAVAAMAGQDLRTAHKEFTVERQLNVTVKPVREAYEPGADGQVELIVTDQLGNPVEAELSLALVDEALFAVFPDRTPSIRDFFQKDARRYAEFRTGATCGFHYEGVTEEVVEEILAEAERRDRVEKEQRQLAELKKRAVLRYAEGKSEQAQAGFLGARPGKPSGAPAPSAESAVELEAGAVRENQLKFAYDRDRAKAARSGIRDEKADGAAGRTEPRRELATAGFWLPAVVTDEAGKAVVQVPMPEKTTEWRLTSRGCSAETLVGESTAKVLTRQDFFVNIKAPAVVREGDDLRVIARIHNLTDFQGKVDVTLDVKGRETKEESLAQFHKTVSVKAQSGTDIVFERVHIPSVINVDLEVRARAGDHEDAVLVTVPVEPWGLEYADRDGGVTDSNARIHLQLPKENTYKRRWLTITVGPVIQQAVLDMAMALERLHPIPFVGDVDKKMVLPPPSVYGGTPAADLLAAVSGLRHAQRGQIPAVQYRRLVDRTRGLATSLTALQGSDGGWTWYDGGGEQSDWAASSQAYWALVWTRDAGIAVDSKVLEKAQTYLQNQFQSLSANDNDAKALVLHALSTDKKADFANLNRLYRARNELSNAALSYSALAFTNLNRNEIAAELLDVLTAKARNVEDDGVSSVFWSHGARHNWMEDDVETTALVLLALARVKPQSPLAERAAQYLLQQRGCFSFRPAKARGAAVAALAEYFGPAEGTRSDYRIDVEVNGREFTHVRSSDSASLQTFAVPSALMTEGENTVAFKISGRGRYAYAATLRGFSPELNDPRSWNYPYVRNRYYYHSRLEYRGHALAARSTSPVRHLESGQRMEVYVDFYESNQVGYLLVEEPLPAGTLLVEGSLSGNFSRYEVAADKITFYYRSGHHIGDIRYELVGYAPGDYRVLPTVIRDAMHPGRMRIGKPNQVAVLAPNETTPDPYQMNRAELFELGRLNFDDGIYDQALEYLAELFKRDRDYNERELARMLLWIYTTPKHYEAARIVEMFEILRERYPQLEIPFDKILVVGQAYRDIGEFERAWLVFRATIDASFVSDSNVSAILQDEGRFIGSVDYQERLWREYPDAAPVASSYFALSQALYNKAPQAHTLPREDGHALSRIDMLTRATDILTEFLTLYPTDPLADDAAFSVANAYLDLENYPLVVTLSKRFVDRYLESPMVSSFQYMTALGLFWQHKYDDALEAARVVADGKSTDKLFAQYIVGQIYHARGAPAEAIEWYSKVKTQYPDAAQAIAYFEKKRIALDEVSIFRPDDPVELTLNSRNIKEASLQIYRVDLMKLYLQEKNLSRITQIRLAGISPEHERTVRLGDGQDYAEKETRCGLPLQDEGAYLVICRGDDLFTSGLVLITPLEIDVQEDPNSGRARVNIRDVVRDSYQAGVHVKAIGSADREFRSGDTDLRGIFVADGLRGKATVIAREGEARYAFYRGDEWLGAREEKKRAELPPQPAQQMDYQQNLRSKNEALQKMNIQQFERMRRTQQKGVEVQSAF